MGENIVNVMARLGEVLHWLGHYEESNAVMLLARLMRAKGISSIDELREHVEFAETRR